MQVPSEVNLSRRMPVTNSLAPTGSPAPPVGWRARVRGGDKTHVASGNRHDQPQRYIFSSAGHVTSRWPELSRCTRRWFMLILVDICASFMSSKQRRKGHCQKLLEKHVISVTTCKEFLWPSLPHSIPCVYFWCLKGRRRTKKVDNQHAAICTDNCVLSCGI